MWSGHTSASIIFTPFLLHSADNILAISCLSFPYATILLYFGANTIWYLHVHLVCDRLLLSNWITSTFYYCVGFGTTFSIEPRGFIFQLDNNTNYSSVLCHTCIAGGFMVYNHKKCTISYEYRAFIYILMDWIV